MRFDEARVGQKIVLALAGEDAQLAWRLILEKVDATTARDDRGRHVPIEPEQEVEPIEAPVLRDAAWQPAGGGRWELVARWETRAGDEAWEALGSAGELSDPEGVRRARTLLAALLHGEGALGRALTLYDDLVTEREEAPVLNNRGAARASAGDLDGALRDYGRALALDPTLVQALSNRGNVFTKLGRFEEALDDYERALELTEDVAPIHCNRGLTRKLQGDLDGSVADFSRALEVDPDFAPAFLARAGSRAAQGDMSGAVADLERFLDLAPHAEQAERVRDALARLRETSR